MTLTENKIVILGGGFGGIQAALTLSRKNIPKLKIVLISDKHHFEYTPALYRVVTGKSPLEVCIPLSEIFSAKGGYASGGKNVEIVIDTVLKINLKENKIEGESGSHYDYDYLVLALGAETAFFGIPGLPEHSFGFKSINQALILKDHLHSLFEEYKKSGKIKGGDELHIDIVGAGPSGIELAGELNQYSKVLAKNHNFPLNTHWGLIYPEILCLNK